MDLFVSAVVTAPYFYFIYWCMFGSERKAQRYEDETAGFVHESDRMSERFQKIERAQRR